MNLRELIKKGMPQTGCFDPFHRPASDELIRKVWELFYDKPWPEEFTQIGRSCQNPNCLQIKHRYPTSEDGRVPITETVTIPMADIETLHHSVSEMTDEELEQRLLDIRKERRATGVKNKVSRALSKDKAVKTYKKRPEDLGKEIASQMTKEQVMEMMKKFGMGE